MPLYNLHCTQNIPIDIDTAWEFISNPRNLAVITPPEMKFQTLSGDDRSIFPGQIIEYKVSPLPGITFGWVTEISHVENRKFFVDEQRYGPYAFWHHKHFLKEIPGGVEMEDIVHYKLPFGFLGKLAHPFLVRPKLENIFDFRKKKLLALFGEFKTI